MFKINLRNILGIYTRTYCVRIFCIEHNDSTNYLLYIYADATFSYSCPIHSFDKANLAADLENDFYSFVNWVRKWPVNFNACKTKQVSFNHPKES